MNSVVFDSLESATAHLAALKAIASADGSIHPKEKQFIDSIAAIYCQRHTEIDLANVLLEPIEDLDLALGSIRTRKNKLILLQDVFSLASIDGKLDQTEETVIDTLAMKMKISEQDLGQLVALNKQLLEANNNLANFLFQATEEDFSDEY